MSQPEPDPLLVFQCRTNVQAMSHKDGRGRDTVTRFVGLSLSATPTTIAFSGTVDEDWLHYLIDPKTAEQLAQQMLGMVAQIRAQQSS